MFFAGKPSDRARWLCEVNREALYEGIKQCGPGVPVNAIGRVYGNPRPLKCDEHAEICQIKRLCSVIEGATIRLSCVEEDT